MFAGNIIDMLFLEQRILAKTQKNSAHEQNVPLTHYRNNGTPPALLLLGLMTNRVVLES